MNTLEQVEGYETLESQIKSRVSHHDGPLFMTDAKDLWEVYLGGLPASRRQHYNCHSCRRFIQTYGGLVTIDADGKQRSFLWEPFNGFFWESVGALESLCLKANVIGVFESEEHIWGTPTTWDPKLSLEWSHLSGKQSSKRMWTSKVKTAFQRSSELREDLGVLTRGLGEYTSEQVDLALRVLASGQMYRSEKAQAILEWFRKCYSMNRNQLWLAVATAPAGFAHVKNTVAGQLLELIRSGLDFEALQAAWAKMLNPEVYQRPQAAPTIGQVAAAEKKVKALGLTLDRRFAKVKDIPEDEILWSSSRSTPQGKFGYLLGKQSKGLEIPGETKITWTRFARDVLPRAKDLQVYVPGHGAFYGLLTGDEDILQWPSRVSWYFHIHGSNAWQWGLGEGWQTPKMIFLGPHQWGGRNPQQHAPMACFALDAVDKETVGPCLFPEILKTELRDIRSVVEAHSKATQIPRGGEVNGLAFQRDPVRVRVDGATYVIDRWD